MGREASALILIMTFLGGMFVSVLWLIIGWRIMRALEAMAAGLDAFLAFHRDRQLLGAAQVAMPGAATPQQDVINKLVQNND